MWMMDNEVLIPLRYSHARYCVDFAFQFDDDATAMLHFERWHVF
jgi:hypothetical protein